MHCEYAGQLCYVCVLFFFLRRRVDQWILTSGLFSFLYRGVDSVRSARSGPVLAHGLYENIHSSGYLSCLWIMKSFPVNAQTTKGFAIVWIIKISARVKEICKRKLDYIKQFFSHCIYAHVFVLISSNQSVKHNWVNICQECVFDFNNNWLWCSFYSSK